MESAVNPPPDSPIYPTRLQCTRRLVFLALLAATAIVLQALESTFPQPAPWLRLGLANMAVVVVLVNFGFVQGLLVNLVRIVLGALITGNLFSPAFALSLSGGTAALLFMWAAHRLGRRFLSLIGVSVIGAYAHTVTQIVVAYLLFIQHRGVFYILPIMLTAALVSGVLNGLGATMLSRHLVKL